MMDLPKRKNLRLENFNYSQGGAYFITVCSKERECMFSRIVGGGILDAPKVELTEAGKIVAETLENYSELHPNVEISDCVIMPNHIHLIVFLSDICGPSGMPAPTDAAIPKLVSSVKRFSNKRYGQNMFQRGYYDHIIRDENDYLIRAKYISDNPAKWLEDEYFHE